MSGRERRAGGGDGAVRGWRNFAQAALRRIPILGGWTKFTGFAHSCWHKVRPHKITDHLATNTIGTSLDGQCGDGIPGVGNCFNSLPRKRHYVMSSS